MFAAQWNRCACGLLLGLLWLLPGCGPPKGDVTGSVTSQGKPVVWGSVTLVDESGLYHQANIDLEGNYEVKGVAAGPVKIAVVSPNPGGRTVRGGGPIDSGVAGEADDPREQFIQGKTKNTDDRPRPPNGAWFPIDPKYNDPESSGLTGKVEAGRSELNITLD
jgi:hypothetical protein